MGIGCDYFARVHATCARYMITRGASGAGGTRDALAIVHAVRVSGCGRAAGARRQAGAAREGAPGIMTCVELIEVPAVTGHVMGESSGRPGT